MTDTYELAAHEHAVLAEACATLDVCDELAQVVDAEGLTVAGQGGTTKIHPALVELRQQRIVLARLLAALRIPGDDVGEQLDGRLQRRVGVRGVYQ